MWRMRAAPFMYVVSFIMVVAIYEPRITCCWVRQEPKKEKCPKTELHRKDKVDIGSLRQKFKATERGLQLYKSCGRTKHDMLDPIIGGVNSPEKAWPWQVYFLGVEDSARCGGALIDRQWLLTAAHCHPKDQVYQIVLGTNDTKRLGMNPHVQVRTGVKFIFYPGYQKKNLHMDDILMVKLNENVTYTDYVFPVCLAQESMSFTSTACSVSGFGRDSPRGAVHPPILKHIRASVIKNDRCALAWTAGRTQVTNKHICLRNWENPALGPCKGDSGGPLSCKVGDYYYLAGIASTVADVVSEEDIHCTGNVPDIYTRISSYSAWILDTMEKN